MAKAARHADPIGPHQLFRQIIVRVVVKALRVPALGRHFVKSRVRKQAQPDNPSRLAVVGSGGDGLAARPDRHTRVFGCVGERVGRAIRAALVEPQPVMLGVGGGGLGKARLVDEAQIGPAIVAAVFEAGRGRQDLQQVERAEGQVGQLVPQPVVAAGPHDPHVAALDLVRGQRDAAVHAMEIIFVGGRQGLRRASRLARLVDDLRARRSAGKSTDCGEHHRRKKAQRDQTGFVHCGPRSVRVRSPRRHPADFLSITDQPAEAKSPVRLTQSDRANAAPGAVRPLEPA